MKGLKMVAIRDVTGISNIGHRLRYNIHNFSDDQISSLYHWNNRD